jgi:hypothetical protein
MEEEEEKGNDDARAIAEVPAMAVLNAKQRFIDDNTSPKGKRYYVKYDSEWSRTAVYEDSWGLCPPIDNLRDSFACQKRLHNFVWTNVD